MYVCIVLRWYLCGYDWTTDSQDSLTESSSHFNSGKLSSSFRRQLGFLLTSRERSQLQKTLQIYEERRWQVSCLLYLLGSKSNCIMVYSAAWWARNLMVVGFSLLSGLHVTNLSKLLLSPNCLLPLILVCQSCSLSQFKNIWNKLVYNVSF